MALAVALLACALPGVPRVRVELDARSLVPMDDPVLSESDEAVRAFGCRETVVFALAPRRGDVFNAETLDRLRRLQDEVRGFPGVVPDTLLSVLELPRVRGDGQAFSIRSRRPTDALTDADAARLREDLRPLGPSTAALLAGDGRAVALVVEVEPGGDRRGLLAAARRAAAAVRAGGTHDLYFTGTAFAQAELGAATARDLVRLLPLVLGIVGAALWCALGSARRALLSLAEIVFSLVCTIGLMGWRGETVFITTLVLPVVLIVVGVSDDVYVIGRYVAALARHPDADRSGLVESAFGALTRPIAFTTLSTVIGLGSLAVGGLGPLRVLGVYGPVAILASWLSTFTVVPAGLVLFDRAPGRDSVRYGLERALGGLLPRRPMRRLAALAAALAGVGAAAACLRVDDDWVGNLPAASDIVAGDRFVAEAFGGTMALLALVDSGRAAGVTDPGLLLALSDLESRAAALPEIGSVRGLPGQVAALARAWNGPPGSAPALPIEEEVGTGVRLLQLAAPQLLSSVVDEDGRRARVTLLLRAPDHRAIGRVMDGIAPALRAVERRGARVVMAGDAWVSRRAVELLVSSQLLALPLAMALDVVLFTLLLRSFGAALVSALPVLASIAVLAALLVATGTSLGVANSMSAAIVLGVGFDFSLHLVERWREGIGAGLARVQAAEQALRSVGPGIVAGSCSLAAGFAVLLFASCGTTRQLGAMTAVAVLACAGLALCGLPALWLSGGRRRRVGARLLSSPA